MILQNKKKNNDWLLLTVSTLEGEGAEAVAVVFYTDRHSHFYCYNRPQSRASDLSFLLL